MIAHRPEVLPARLRHVDQLDIPEHSPRAQRFEIGQALHALEMDPLDAGSTERAGQRGDPLEGLEEQVAQLRETGDLGDVAEARIIQSSRDSIFA